MYLEKKVFLKANYNCLSIILFFQSTFKAQLNFYLIFFYLRPHFENSFVPFFMFLVLGFRMEHKKAITNFYPILDIFAALQSSF